ncbi:hypothetical protein T484DRAFT_1811279 [Baffinella frigidus]|nr:hypothetical protein T484DRAFT_1811279 [Cryptophyta sp. CCMP2293]
MVIMYAPSGAGADELECRRTRPGEAVRHQPYSRASRSGLGEAADDRDREWHLTTAQAHKKLAEVWNVPSFLEPGPAKWGTSVLDQLAASGSDLKMRFMLSEHQKIAAGTFGQVYEGKDSETMKDVAIKVVRKGSGSRFVRRLFPTCYATGQMNGHFCIVQVQPLNSQL